MTNQRRTHFQAKGFTLLEVVIAVTILSFISLFTVEAIQHALQTKAKVQSGIDRTSTVRDALRVIERDINMAYNYHDTYIELYNMAQKLRQKTANTPTQNQQNPMTGFPYQQNPMQNQPNPATPTDPDKYKPKVEKIYTQFIGDPNSLDFTTLSNVRMMEDQPISSQAEIGYHLKPCRLRSTQEQATNCLWRRIANYIHDDITREDGHETVLLENVTLFKLRYLGPGRADGEWVDTWITNERGDDQTKNHFPWAVEITIEVKNAANAKDKPLRMTMVAAIRNPNNPNPNDTKDPANAIVNPNDMANQQLQQQQSPNSPLTPGAQSTTPGINQPAQSPITN